MKRIFKYCLGYQPGVKEVPGIKALCVQAQDNEPTLWAEVCPDIPSQRLRIQVVLTGENAPTQGEYLGTVQLHHGEFVLHYYLIP